MEFHEMLRKMVIEKASDLFIKVGSPPSLRIDGAVHFLDTDEITQQDALEIFEIIEDSKKEGFEAKQDIDVAYEIPGIGRFRCNILRQKGNLGFVLRHIESNVPSFEELNLPGVVLTKLAAASRGLILVTGQAGCGKSTTLASMINYVNEKFNKHVVTIEDPIEFIFKDRKSIVNQREIGVDTPNFITALKMAVRQSPDVILIGEMRDKETMEAALSAAETGHLVLSTLHTVNALQTVERIIHFFPPHQQSQVRVALTNLVRNAVEAAGPEGWAGVRVEADGASVSFIVEDSGPGPAPAQREHLFDPFYSGRSAGRGRGLGLPTAWRLARQNGGAVHFAGASAEATRFVLTLPAAPEPPAPGSNGNGHHAERPVRVRPSVAVAESA